MKSTTDHTDNTDGMATPAFLSVLSVESVVSCSDRAMHELIHKELSQSIIGAAMTVLNALKPGLSEKIYENALVIELTKRGHKVEQQRQYPVYYDGILVGNLVPDLIVDDKVIADPKVVASFNDAHQAQMIGYLKITGLKLALLLNFKTVKLDWKRVVN